MDDGPFGEYPWTNHPWASRSDAPPETIAARRTGFAALWELRNALGTQEDRHLTLGITPDLMTKVAEAFGDSSRAALVNFLSGLIDLFFDRPEEFIGENGTVSTLYRVEFMEPHIFEDLYRFIGYFFAKAAGDSGSVLTDELVDFFQEWIQSPKLQFSTDRESNRTIASTTAALLRWEREFDRLVDSFESHFSARAAAAAAKRAEKSAIAAQRAAGKAGAESLGEHFHEISETEEKAATLWTRAAFAFVASVLVVAAAIVFKVDFDGWVEAVVHLALVLPLVGAASYASRIARHHRQFARWARTASVQVNSVEAFANQLSSEENKDRLILSLGQNVFAPPSYDDSKGDHYSSLPPDVVDALRAFAERIRLPGQ